jgi:hypothetical protein
MPNIDVEFIKQVEAAHFRTVQDTGANHNALLIWNCVRKHVGLPALTLDDLPRYCVAHNCYHLIRQDYGCVEREVV